MNNNDGAFVIENILQIMPVQPGWVAVWLTTKSDEERGANLYETEVLVCWALVEGIFGQDDQRQRLRKVVGMVSIDEGEIGLQAITESPYFLGYSHRGKNMDWNKIATMRRKQLRKMGGLE